MDNVLNALMPAMCCGRMGKSAAALESARARVCRLREEARKNPVVLEGAEGANYAPSSSSEARSRSAGSAADDAAGGAGAAAGILQDERQFRRDGHADARTFADQPGRPQQIDVDPTKRVGPARSRGRTPKHRGHDQRVIGDLPSSHARPHPAERQEQDKEDAAMLRHRPAAGSVTPRRSSSAAPSRSVTPQPRRTGFTDRAMRQLDQGSGARDALTMVKDATRCESKCPGELSKECFAQPPAGIVGHLNPAHRPPICGRDDWEGGNRAGVVNRSPSVGDIQRLEEMEYERNCFGHHDAEAADEEQAPALAGAPLNPSEAAFRKRLVRKRRGDAAGVGTGHMMQHKGSEDGPVAGNYDRSTKEDPRKGRAAWQGRMGDPPKRSGIALIIDPSEREGDPSRPTKIVSRIKGPGGFAATQGASEAVHREAVKWNPEAFRMEHFPFAPRGRSLPPPDSAGLTSKQVWRGVFSWQEEEEDPQLHVRKAKSNRSASVRLATNQEAVAEEDFEIREARLRHDPAFAQLCRNTDEVQSDMRESVMSYCAKLHAQNSEGVAGILQWE